MIKIIVDEGATINLMSHFIIKKIGKSDMDTKPHNMMLSNYEVKVGSTLGVIRVDLRVDTITRATMFMVIESKKFYNIWLGREWINGIGVVPSSFH